MVKLEVISGGRRDRLDINGTAVVAAAADAAPFGVQARILEEDAFLVLSAEPEVREVATPPVRVFDRAFNLEPKALGTLVVRGGSPLEILAVVHDLDRTPSAREDEVHQAYVSAWVLLAERKVRRAAVPLLGVAHRGLDPASAARALVSSLQRAVPGAVEGLWLVVAPGAETEMIALLERTAAGLG